MDTKLSMLPTKERRGLTFRFCFSIYLARISRMVSCPVMTKGFSAELKPGAGAITMGETAAS
ncbi:hypothetical protein D3C75_1237650 [compost metagenome]